MQKNLNNFKILTNEEICMNSGSAELVICSDKTCKIKNIQTKIR